MKMSLSATSLYFLTFFCSKGVLENGLQVLMDLSLEFLDEELGVYHRCNPSNVCEHLRVGSQLQSTRTFFQKRELIARRKAE